MPKSTGDSEALTPVTFKTESDGTRSDPDLVVWEGPNDPSNPKNWTLTKRWSITVLNSLFMFVSPISSSMVAPAFGVIRSDFVIKTDFETQMVLSIFVLASALGPLVISPLSEVYGRRPVLHITCLTYLVFNLACAFSKTSTQLLIFRFLAGVGGSAPSIGGGILADCWKAHERGKSLGFYYIFPLMGPAVGPIIGAFIVQHTTWKWMFYATSILSALIQFIGIFALPETYGPKILHNKAAKLRKSTGNPRLHTKFEERNKSVYHILLQALIRPTKLLCTQPIIQVLALYTAYVYGLMYLALSTFPLVWEDIYGQRADIAGLNYISLALGFCLATQICAPINDYIYARLKRRNGGIELPEYRIPLMIPGAILIPLGFFCYGWSIQVKAHWIVPNIGAALFGSGIIITMQCVTSYVIDAYSIYSASSIAAITVLRALAGFDSGNLQDTWLVDFDPNKDQVYFASSANGWSSDEYRLNWLEKVFHQYTKFKAGRSWQLLLVNSQDWGSYTLQKAGFTATGIHPLSLEQMLSQCAVKNIHQQQWLSISLRKVIHASERLVFEKELLIHENKALYNTLNMEKKHCKYGRPLELVDKKNLGTAQFFLSSQVEAAHQWIEAAETAKIDKLAQAEAAKLQYNIQCQERAALAAAKKAACCEAQLTAAEQYKKAKAEAAA
ncbi:hypothetical protein AJ80_06690 [Polytolypa hystricis UAMH7299]|uniref:Major facilitator superfamily (MFS) profile domain-containing protein n=1 Tax=Polytolypa hystricis (strain UAMH7299) TaxID=1447883 RepID=A0A2B7XU86_POLH7|nr:hypothetical protein AJ80_06690 [Polytolypa hystricis UAMH7299]